MAMYAIGILPLIQQLSASPATQAWFADDATAGGHIQHLHEWCMDKTAQLRAILWLLCQPSHEPCLAHRERRAPTICINDICKHRCQHHHKWKASSGCRPGLHVICRKLCMVQGQPVGRHSEEVIFYCPHSATRCLLRPHPWPCQQMELLDAHHPRHL